MRKLKKNNTKKETEFIVKPDSRLNSTQELGMVKLFKMLAPNIRGCEIDIPMILDKAFPAFEATVGRADFQKVKYFFGIEKNVLQLFLAPEAEIREIVQKLRTVENARYYLTGYEKLLNDLADKFFGAPEDVSMMVKAKIARIYTIIIMDGHFFSNEIGLMDGRNVVNSDQIVKNCYLQLLPEDLFWIYSNRLMKMPAGNLNYNLVVWEIMRLEPSLRKEILGAAELKLKEEKFISTNKVWEKSNYSELRLLKIKVAPIPSHLAPEVMALKSVIVDSRLEYMYCLYKIMMSKPYEEFADLEVEKATMTHYGAKMTKVTCKVIFENIIVSSKDEFERIKFAIENGAGSGLTLKAQIVPDGEEKEVEMEVRYGVFWGAILFGRRMNFLTIDNSLEEDALIANALVDRADGDSWIRYWNNEISDEEMFKILNLDSEFISKHLTLKKEETPIETIKRFVVESGLGNIEEISEELITEVVIPGNEDAISKFAAGEISAEHFKKKLGVEEQFAPMYFDYKKIEIPELENKLLELKNVRSDKELKKSALTVSLYCHVIQNQKKCGPKMKVPKGNKRLKPQNLLARIS